MRYSFGLIGAFALLAVGAPLVHAARYDACGNGRVVWPDGAAYRALVGARVYLMDEDVGFDDELKSGYTDADGRFNLCGRGGDSSLCWGTGCTRPDLYIKVELENSDITIENELFFNRYATTPTHDNTAGAIDFGTFTFKGEDGRDATILFARTKQAYDYFRQQLGARIPRHNGRVRVKFPAYLANGTPWTTEESIHWPGGYDEYNAIYHEFGHRVRHALDGNYAHFLYDAVRFGYARTHNPRMKTNEGFAFNEGWAEYFSTLLDPAEKQTFAQWQSVDGGDSVEGNVAAKILWLSDNCGGFKAMWTALASASIHSYRGFEAAVKRRNPACGAPVIVSATGPLVAIATRKPVALDKQMQAASRISAETVDKLNAKVALQRERNKEIAKALASAAAAPLLKLELRRRERRIELLGSIQTAFAQANAAVKAISPDSIADKSYSKNRADVRDRLVRQVVGAWRKTIADTRKEIAQARDKARTADDRTYLDGLEKKQKAIEGHLRVAQATGRLPVQLLPTELQGRTEDAK